MCRMRKKFTKKREVAIERALEKYKAELESESGKEETNQ